MSSSSSTTTTIQAPANNPLLPASLVKELNTLYTSPTRPAHTLTHRNSLLSHLTLYKPHFHDPSAIEAAIWIHDAIHDPRAPDNESRSADLAARHLSSFPDRARVKRVLDMVLATASHTLPKFPSKKHQKDAELFLDIDLSVLGATREEYQAYEEAVRMEYEWVDEVAWITGRGSVLRGFLERPHVYHTKIMREKYETQAQENLALSLKKLFRPKLELEKKEAA